MELLGLSAVLYFTFLLSLVETDYMTKIMPEHTEKMNEKHISKEDYLSYLTSSPANLWNSAYNIKMNHRTQNMPIIPFSIKKDITEEINTSENKKNIMNPTAKMHKRSISLKKKEEEKVLEGNNTLDNEILFYNRRNMNAQLVSKNIKFIDKSPSKYFLPTNAIDSLMPVNKCRIYPKRESLNMTALIFAVENKDIKFITRVNMKKERKQFGDSPPVTEIKPSHFAGFVLKADKNEILVHTYENNFYPDNNSFKVLTSSLLDAEVDYSNTLPSNLTQNFKCIVNKKEILNVSCCDIKIYTIGEYLPNTTEILHLSYSPQEKMTAPLFPHLSNLKSLTLSNNHHRYITKAFVGLKSLEILDLSNNDIAVILSALTYIPNLKTLNLSNNKILNFGLITRAIITLKDLEYLILAHNRYIEVITKDSMHHLTNSSITYLNLYNTSIYRIERESFTVLSHLKTLEISLKSTDPLTDLVCGIPINLQHLYLRQFESISDWPEEVLNCLSNTLIQFTYTHSNFLEVIPKFLNSSRYKISWGLDFNASFVESTAFQDVTILEVLFMSYNEILRIPKAAFFIAKTVKKLFISYQIENENSVFSIGNYTLQNFTDLEEIHLSGVRSEGKLFRYNLHGMGRLKQAHFFRINLKEIEDFAFETLKLLEILDLKDNSISYISNFTFFGLRNLRKLDLSQNKIHLHPSRNPFRHSPFLNTLLIQDNNLETIPPNMFLDLKFLKTLMLTRNLILPWNQKILHPNSKISALGLSGNEITYVSKTMLEEFHLVTETLDLSKNPFNCSVCEMHNFQSFCQNSNLSWRFIVPKWEILDYKCLEPRNLRNESFFEVQLPGPTCKEVALIRLMTLLLVLSSVLVILLAISLCYIFRWYVKYYCFLLKMNFIIQRGSTSHDKSFNYDAFVAYNSKDNPWLVNYLISSLENQEPRYRLCIHERDFMVGNLITENISQAIDSSRKVLLILSKNFIKSDWCKFELHLAQHRLFRDARDSLILIKLENIDKKLYTKNIAYLEKTRRCLTWPESQEKQEEFWCNLKKELGQPARYKKHETV